MTATEKLIEHYQLARGWIRSSPYWTEVKWQQTRSLSLLDESSFLREYAWVVLSSGFRASVVQKYFDYISLCFCDWECASSIETHRSICIESAMTVFRNRSKLEAIADGISLVYREGFDQYLHRVRKDPSETLRELPYIGPVTMWHLAKNIGADVAKPDRHLIRVAERFGYDTVSRMCNDISRAVGDTIAVADIVLWRFEERSFGSQRR